GSLGTLPRLRTSGQTAPACPLPSRSLRPAPAVGSGMSTRKPWYRARNIILAVLLLIVALLGIETYRAITAKPGNPIDYTARLNELVLSWQPAEAPNGWDAWTIALQTMDAQIAQNRQKYLNVP